MIDLLIFNPNPPRGKTLSKNSIPKHQRCKVLKTPILKAQTVANLSSESDSKSYSDSSHKNMEEARNHSSLKISSFRSNEFSSDSSDEHFRMIKDDAKCCCSRLPNANIENFKRLDKSCQTDCDLSRFYSERNEGTSRDGEREMINRIMKRIFVINKSPKSEITRTKFLNNDVKCLRHEVNCRKSDRSMTQNNKLQGDMNNKQSRIVSHKDRHRRCFE
ncbi:MAG: hypothetical protein MHMPM18_002795 [Marteilia pararefringens]